MNLILTNIYLFILATVLAVLEIQIEGKGGWAKNLPTWRPDPNHPLAKIYSKMMSGKEVTGYHLSMFLFVFLVFNFPFAFGLPLTPENWLKILAFYFIFLALWDFMWFVLNPYYPLKNFAKNNPNHKTFFAGLPSDYYFCVIAALVICLFGDYILGIPLLGWYFENLSLFIIETVVAIIFSLYVLNIDNWDKK